MKTKKIINFFKSDRKYFLLVAICFLYAGFALVSFGITLYAESFSQNNFNENSDFNISLFNNNSDFNFSSNFRNPGARRPDLFGVMLGASAMNFLIGGLVSLLSGVALASLLLKKGKKEITHKITSKLLLPDEKKVFDLLARSTDGLTQSKLTLESNLGKVKISRIVSKLEEKGIIDKHKYGATNKIFLKDKM